MLTLTTALAVRNIQKMRVVAVALDGDSLIATVTIAVIGAGNTAYSTVEIMVQNGVSQGIRATVAPVGYTDIVQVFTLSTPTGFSDFVAAYTGNIGPRNKAVESVLLAAGLLPPGTVA